MDNEQKSSNMSKIIDITTALPSFYSSIKKKNNNNNNNNK